jgi:hypothetical protein
MHATSQKWREAMAEAIAEAEAEGAMEEYEDVGNIMSIGAAAGAGNDAFLQRGLNEGVTGRPRPEDLDHREPKRAEILRGKQSMTLSL